MRITESDKRTTDSSPGTRGGKMNNTGNMDKVNFLKFDQPAKIKRDVMTSNTERIINGMRPPLPK